MSADGGPLRRCRSGSGGEHRGLRGPRCRRRTNARRHRLLPLRANSDLDDFHPRRVVSRAALGVRDRPRPAPVLRPVQCQRTPRCFSDCEELFRRMVYSVAMHNTDDHLRNHGFVADMRDGSSARQSRTGPRRRTADCCQWSEKRQRRC
ncbi:HipA domain-containing protein [Brevibacterium casei]|uniref:HipA domain-containing protein n=1 Tax=Brevibacterium casei TaxID=33889 RepID=UPI0009DAFE35